MRARSALIVVAAVSVLVSTGSAGELFIGEYVEGGYGKTEFDKAIEICNTLAFPYDLELNGVVLQVYADGSFTPMEIFLVGIVPPAGGGCFVIANLLADPVILAVADQVDQALLFDGNDAVVLAQYPMQAKSEGGERQVFFFDAIGQIGFDPPLGCWCTPIPPAVTCNCDSPLSTLDAVLRHDSAPIIPIDPFAVFDFDPGVWGGYPADNFGGLGQPGQVPVELMSFTIE